MVGEDDAGLAHRAAHRGRQLLGLVCGEEIARRGIALLEERLSLGGEVIVLVVALQRAEFDDHAGIRHVVTRAFV